jgi:hypothetical protein
MTHANNSRHLLQAAALKHDLAVARTRAAIESLDRAEGPLTFTVVARTAGVSRGWLYNQTDLRDTITRLRQDRLGIPSVPSPQRATPASLRQRLDGMREEAARLREENAVLRDQLARQLGEARSQR